MNHHPIIRAFLRLACIVVILAAFELIPQTARATTPAPNAYTIKICLRIDTSSNEGRNICSSAGSCNSTAKACFCPTSNGPAITIGDGLGVGTLGYDQSKLKFVIAHEYGHANHWYGSANWINNDCSYSEDGSGHRLRGREDSTYAAIEGWAHFVSGDIFNAHSTSGSSNPQAELFYLDGDSWDLGDGSCAPEGCCPDSPLVGEYPGRNQRQMYRICHSGTGATIGTEMDWARLFWDYHVDTSLVRSPRTHSELQTDLSVSDSWGIITAYATIRNALSTTPKSRWKAAAEYNGVCGGGSC